MSTYEVKFINVAGYDDFIYVKDSSEIGVRKQIFSAYGRVNIIKIEQVEHYNEAWFLEVVK